jgi:hypothetical protein
MTNRHSTPVALMAAVLGFLTTPASAGVAQQMAARGLPFGYYWLQDNGNWGFEGNSDVVGNIYGRRPSLSERGQLYYPGELLR